MLNFSFAHHHHAVRKRQSLFLVVGDVDEGNTEFLMHLLELQLHVLTHLQVQRCQGFVKQQHFRLVDDSARDGYTLLLTSGERVHITELVVAHAYGLQRLFDAFHDRVCVQFLQFQTKRHIIIHI